MYAIQNKDGLFSTGGDHPTFTKTGRRWDDLRMLNNHLALFKYGNWDHYKDCKIVTFELTVVEGETVSLNEIFEEQKEVAMLNKLKGNPYY